MNADEPRLALFLDYENLAIGARESGLRFDLRPISDALAARGRGVVRRAYADWSHFRSDRDMLVAHQVELIEIPQRRGVVRKNAADIKLAVDAVELALGRDYISTFVIGTGDSDFTPLVHKLRELDRHVIGVGIEASTSDLLPRACDEFLFYDRLEGVSGVTPSQGTRRPQSASKQEPAEATSGDARLTALVASALGGLKRASDGAVTASALKRAILRQQPTFSEADYGFRSFGELVRHLEKLRVVELSRGPARGDPEIDFADEAALADPVRMLLTDSLRKLGGRGRWTQLGPLKSEMLRAEPGFDEKQLGFGSFLQLCRTAEAQGILELSWDERADEYQARLPSAA